MTLFIAVTVFNSVKVHFKLKSCFLCAFYAYDAM